MNQNGPHSMAEQKCFEFVLSHKYDRLNGLKGHTTSHGPKWGKMVVPTNQKFLLSGLMMESNAQQDDSPMISSINDGLFWSILVHIMGDPTTPP